MQKIEYLGGKYEVKEGGCIYINDKKYTVISEQKDLDASKEIKPYFFNCEIKIRPTDSEKGNLTYFTGCIFNQVVNLEQCHLVEPIFTEESIIQNSTFSTALATSTPPLNEVIFYNSVDFYGNIKLLSCNSSLEIGVSCKVDSTLSNYFIFCKKATFNNVEFNSNTELFLDTERCKDADLSFINCIFNKKFKIRNIETRDYEKDQQNKAQLKSLKIIDCTTEDNTYLRFGFLKVQNFEIKNLRNPQNAELNIGDCYFSNFQLSNFRNIGKFKLYKINIFDDERGKKFQIDNTSIGNTDLQSIHLASFKKVVMFDNIFTNIDYTNIIWQDDKDDIEVGPYGGIKFEDFFQEKNNRKRINEKDVIEYLRFCHLTNKRKIVKQQDTYRTLKSVASKNNDQPQAIKFYAKEMENYRQNIKNKNILSGDRITLAFNYWTNNFGLNWWRPIIILLFVTLLFYLLLLCSLGMTICNLDHWQYIAEFLSPIHKFDWVIGFLPNLIDITFRIIEGLFLYQIIQALRKYSKKL